MSRTSPKAYVLEIEDIDRLLLKGRRAKAENILRYFPRGICDLGVEVAEVLFSHGLLHHAEDRCDEAYDLLLGDAPQHASTWRDVLWLRANIAWQRGRMPLAASRLTEIVRRLGPNDAAESLRSAADSVAKLVLHRRRDARRLADDALLRGKGFLTVRFAAGIVLREVDPQEGQAVLAELVDPQEGAGSEEMAYANAARAVLGEGARQAMAPDWSPHDRMAYGLAKRYADAVRDLVDGTRIPRPEDA